MKNPDFSIPDYITLSNGILGFIAITYILDGRPWISSILITICIGLDGLDGWLARRWGEEHLLGTYMDVFADTLSFCFAPALILYYHYYNIELGPVTQSIQNGAAYVVPVMLVFFGILRLGRFSTESGKKENYTGLPTPIVAFVVVTSTALFGRDALLAYRPILALGITFILGSMLYSRVPYPKVRGPFLTLAGSFLLIITLVGLILAKISYPMGAILLLISTVISLGYVITGPLLVLKHGKENGS